MNVRIIVGSCLDVLPTLEAKSVQCCVTSPPYYGLRDYNTATWEGGAPACEHRAPRGDETAGPKQKSNNGSTGRYYKAVCARCGARRVDAQLGLEDTPAEFIANMVKVFREVWRVLRDDGTLWLNIGDSYAGSGKGPTGHNGIGDQERRQGFRQGNPSRYKDGQAPSNRDGVGYVPGFKAKDLCMIPARLAIALQEDGWYLRSQIVWCKRAPMPESVTDRPTSATEMIYLFAKKPNYFYDAEAVREPYNPETVGRYQYAMMGTAPGARQPGGDIERREREKGVREPNPAGRNQRNFWLLGPEPLKGEHYAAFPTEIPRRAILAGTSERGCCGKCGAPWRRQVEDTPEYRALKVGRRGTKGYESRGLEAGNRYGSETPGVIRQSVTTGWAPTCRCDAGEPVPCTVFDPFFGAGTTGLVADRLGRNAIGIELSPIYARMAEDRIRADAPMLADVAVETLQKEVA